MDETTRRAKATHETAIRFAAAGMQAKSKVTRETAAARHAELVASYKAKFGTDPA